MNLTSPKKVKYKSPHLYLSQKGLKGLNVTSSISIKSRENYLLSPRHREICRRILARTLKEDEGDLNIRFFPHLSRSKKPLQVRMGKGKGSHSKWTAPVKEGNPLIEIRTDLNDKIINKLYRRIRYRLPIHTKLLYTPKRVLVDYKKVNVTSK